MHAGGLTLPIRQDWVVGPIPDGGTEPQFFERDGLDTTYAELERLGWLRGEAPNLPADIHPALVPQMSWSRPRNNGGGGSASTTVGAD